MLTNGLEEESNDGQQVCNSQEDEGYHHEEASEHAQKHTDGKPSTDHTRAAEVVVHRLGTQISKGPGEKVVLQSNTLRLVATSTGVEIFQGVNMFRLPSLPVSRHN
jgi:hypothetical protein